MIIRRSRRYTINMGDYESYSFGADVEMSNRDMGISDDEIEKLSDDEFQEIKDNLTANVLEELNRQLADEINDSATLTKNKKSYLLKAFGIKTRSDD